MSIVDVKEMVEKKKQGLKRQIAELRDKGVVPKLAVILANNDEASRIYVGKKRKISQELGIDETEYLFDEDVTTKEILEVIDRLNKNKEVHGILVQLPLYKHLDEEAILNSVSEEKDVDGFSAVNIGKLYQGIGKIMPCTPKGIYTILKELGVELEGKNAVIVGRSLIVGKPIAAILLNEGCTVTICHSKTKDLSEHTKNADILVVATGVPHLIKEDMVKEGVVVIDVGLTKVNEKLVGDVDTENVAKKAKYITPAPGGVGITTVYSLAENVVELAKRNVK